MVTRQALEMFAQKVAGLPGQTIWLVGPTTMGGGGVTVIVWQACTELLQSSTAVQQRVITNGQRALVTAVKLMVTLVSQRSKAVTEPGAGTSAKQRYDWLPGTPTSTGGSVSSSRMVWLHCERLP